MALSIDNIYQICQYLVNKYKQGYLSPSEFNYTFNLAQNQYFNYLTGERPEEYQPNHQLNARGKLFNRTMREKLAPFYQMPVLNASGTMQVSKPAGFASLVEMLLSPSLVPVIEIPQNKLNSYLTDSIDVVTISAPVAVDAGSYYQIYPLTGWTFPVPVVFSYYQQPPDAVWAYTTGGDGLPVYNAGASTNPIWNNNEYSEIISRMLGMIGINLSNNQVIQYSGLQKQEG